MDRDTAIEKRLRDMPQTCRGVYRRAVTGKSLRAAVNAFCLECVGYQRREITECTDLGCPLYAHHPKYGTASEAGAAAGVPMEGHDGPVSRAESTIPLEPVSRV